MPNPPWRKPRWHRWFPCPELGKTPKGLTGPTIRLGPTAATDQAEGPKCRDVLTLDLTDIGAPVLLIRRFETRNKRLNMIFAISINCRD